MSALCMVLILGLSLYAIVRLVLCCMKLCVKKAEQTISTISKETVKQMILELKKSDIEEEETWTGLRQIKLE